MREILRHLPSLYPAYPVSTASDFPEQTGFEAICPRSNIHPFRVQSAHVFSPFSRTQLCTDRAYRRTHASFLLTDVMP